MVLASHPFIFEVKMNLRAQMHLECFATKLQRPTLFIHGNLASNQWWYPVMRCLRSTEGSAALLAEWGGCGWSTKGDFAAEEGMSALARQYAQLLRGFASDTEFDVVAHSTGCLIALHLVIQSPELIRKLVLLDPVSPSGLTLSPYMRAAFDHMAADRAFCREVMRSTVNPNSLPELFEQYVDSAHRAVDQLRHWVPDALVHGGIPVPCERIQHEVLVLHGQDDPILPLEDAQGLAQDLPHGRFVLIPECGHSMNVEDPERFGGILLEFLSSSSTQDSFIRPISSAVRTERDSSP